MARVKFGDVAIERRETCKGSKSGYPVVGLEHLIPENINLTMWDESGVNTFTKMFHKGDVLFGRRRAYLKKAVIAPFDGICSGDITVIAARPEKILPELLPFVVQNNTFFDYAVGKSAGSLSPRVKWEYLREYEFDLPALDEQRKLARVLWAVNDTVEAYKRLMAATDELVRGQFAEMFGDIITNPKKWEVKRLSTIADYFIGLTYKPSDVADSGTIVLRAGNIQNGALVFDDIIRVVSNVSPKLIVKKNDILMCSRNGSNSLVGKVAKIPNLTETMTFGAFMTIIRSVYHDYLFTYFQMPAFRRQIVTSKTSTINQITKAMLDNINVPLPPYDLQQQFADFVHQADKSKASLQKALTAAKNICRKIISDNLR